MKPGGFVSNEPIRSCPVCDQPKAKDEPDLVGMPPRRKGSVPDPSADIFFEFLEIEIENARLTPEHFNVKYVRFLRFFRTFIMRYRAWQKASR